MKFYLDEDLSPRIGERLRQRGLDAISAIEAGNIQLSDRDQLAFAVSEGRSLVTRNARHFVLLAQEAIARQKPHAGIIVCSPRRRGFEIRTIVDALARVAMQFPRGLGPYDVLYI
ncbi:MAG: DUF5615 family PIN-like protein [Candidatus Methylomirabilales bacterium]